MGRLLTLAVALIVLIGWAHPAQAQAPITIEQKGFTLDAIPLTGDDPASVFYDYRALQANTGFEASGKSLLFFYQNTQTGILSLVAIHGAPALDVTNSTGIVRFIIDRLPRSSFLEVQDDPQDQYEFDPPIATLRWKWHTGRTDGVVISDLGDDFDFRIAPHFIQGVNEWVVLSNENGNIKSTVLPELNQTLSLKTGAAAGRGVRADFSIHPSSNIHTFTPIAFDASSSLVPADSSISMYEWDFDGDGLFDAQVGRPVVSHAYQQSGLAKVTLRVTTIGGTTSVTSKEFTVLSQIGARGIRHISTPTALPERTFRVTLTIHVEQDMAGLGVEEIWPASWIIEAVQNDGAVLKPERGQWVFPNNLTRGDVKTIVYDVTIPHLDFLAGLPNIFEVEGILTANFPRFKAEIDGEKQIEIAACLSRPVALAHFDFNTGNVDLRLSEAISARQLSYAQSLWFEGGTLPDTCYEGIDIEAFQIVMSYHNLDISVDQPLPNGGILRGVRVDRTIMTNLPNAELYRGMEELIRFRVQLDIDIMRDLTSLAITEILPTDWEVLPATLLDVVYHDANHEWLILGPLVAGQSRTLVYDVIVPKSTVANDYYLRGSTVLPDSAFSEVTGGDNHLNVVDCLSMLVAISHWDVENNAIDLSMDNIIKASQAVAAADNWLYDIPIPGTCGEVPDLEMVQLITNYALAGVPVDQPLPDN